MIKIFERDGKVNFVDDNNVVVGYDMFQQCCENADYVFLNSEFEELNEIPNLDDYIFDRSVSYDYPYEKENEYYCEEESYILFKLLNPDEILYLKLFNVHNGYYSHGFTFENDGEVIENGYL